MHDKQLNIDNLGELALLSPRFGPNSPELRLLKFLLLAYNHITAISFLATTLDSTSFTTPF